MRKGIKKCIYSIFWRTMFFIRCCVFYCFCIYCCFFKYTVKMIKLVVKTKIIGVHFKRKYFYQSLKCHLLFIVLLWKYLWKFTRKLFQHHFFFFPQCSLCITSFYTDKCCHGDRSQVTGNISTYGECFHLYSFLWISESSQSHCSF